MLIATFGPTTGWVGKTITCEGAQFVLEDHGPLTAGQVATYDRQGHLVWARDDLRTWVHALAEQAGPATTPRPLSSNVVWGGGPSQPAGLSAAAKTVIGVGIGLLVLILIVGVAILSGDSNSSGSAPSGAGAPGFTADEQTSLDFIVSHVPVLERIFNEQSNAVDHLSNFEFDQASTHVKTYVSEWNNLSDEWESFPAAGGRVASAEMSFETAANDLRDMNMGLLDVLNGGSSDAATTAVTSFASDLASLKSDLSDLGVGQ